MKLKVLQVLSGAVLVSFSKRSQKGSLKLRDHFQNAPRGKMKLIVYFVSFLWLLNSHYSHS